MINAARAEVATVANRTTPARTSARTATGLARQARVKRPPRQRPARRQPRPPRLAPVALDFQTCLVRPGSRKPTAWRLRIIIRGLLVLGVRLIRARPRPQQPRPAPAPRRQRRRQLRQVPRPRQRPHRQPARQRPRHADRWTAEAFTLARTWRRAEAVCGLSMLAATTATRTKFPILPSLANRVHQTATRGMVGASKAARLRPARRQRQTRPAQRQRPRRPPRLAPAVLTPVPRARASRPRSVQRGRTATTWATVRTACPESATPTRPRRRRRPGLAVRTWMEAALGSLRRFPAWATAALGTKVNRATPLARHRPARLQRHRTRVGTPETTATTALTGLADGF